MFSGARRKDVVFFSTLVLMSDPPKAMQKALNKCFGKGTPCFQLSHASFVLQFANVLVTDHVLMDNLWQAASEFDLDQIRRAQHGPDHADHAQLSNIHKRWSYDEWKDRVKPEKFSKRSHLPEVVNRLQQWSKPSLPAGAPSEPAAANTAEMDNPAGAPSKSAAEILDDTWSDSDSN